MVLLLIILLWKKSPVKPTLPQCIQGLAFIAIVTVSAIPTTVFQVATAAESMLKANHGRTNQNNGVASEENLIREGTSIPATAGRVVMLGRRWGFIADTSMHPMQPQDTEGRIALAPVSSRSAGQVTRSTLSLQGAADFARLGPVGGSLPRLRSSSMRVVDIRPDFTVEQPTDDFDADRSQPFAVTTMTSPANATSPVTSLMPAGPVDLSVAYQARRLLGPARIVSTRLAGKSVVDAKAFRAARTRVTRDEPSFRLAHKDVAYGEPEQNGSSTAFSPVGHPRGTASGLSQSKHPQHPLMLAENLSLQRIVDAIRHNASDDRWILSGTVTEFFGQNRMVVKTAQRNNAK